MRAEIDHTIQVLKSGGTIIYPTDTIWGVGCDATNALAVSKVFELKQRAESKSLILLVDSMEMLQQYISHVPSQIIDFLKTSNRPTSVIYKHPSGLAKNVIAKDDSVAIRIVKHEFCKKLIETFGKPIVSTSANLSDHPAPNSFSEINPLLLKEADYIVNLPAIESKNTASQIIKVNDIGEIEFLRK